jgi:glyoxylase-like metal-dependent hydrolase (beta-lactamase superfamily II)
MSDEIRRLQVGAATIHLINIGDVQEDLNRWFELSEAQRVKHQALLAQPARLPIQCIHVALPGASLLVDAGLYDYPPDSPLLIPGYRPAIDLFGGLAQIGVQPASITHVIITHAHGDHFNALTGQHNGQHTPMFPNARHFVGQGDWLVMQEALTKADSLESQTFGVVQAHGLLETVAETRDLGNGIQIIPTPGESPGHQAVRIHSQGQTLYCLGDLYHLTAEVEHPELVVRWTNGELNRRSRTAFNPLAIQENALLIATHIASIGRLQTTALGYRWDAA